MNVSNIHKTGLVFILSLVVLFFISSCLKQTRKKIYFIPRGYKGWVNIVYVDTAKSLQPFYFEDGYIYMVTGDPSNFRIKYDRSLDNWHEVDYYYYDKDSISKINSKIYFNKTLGSPGNNNDVRQKINAYSFFVSDETELNEDPENPIFERYK